MERNCSSSYGKKNGNSERIVAPEIVAEGTNQVLNTLVGLGKRGITKLDSNATIDLIQQMRQDLTPKVFDATIDSIKKEIERPDFDIKTSHLLESHGGGGGGESLLLLIKEIFGFGSEAGKHVIS